MESILGVGVSLFAGIFGFGPALDEPPPTQDLPQYEYQCQEFHWVDEPGFPNFLNPPDTNEEEILKKLTATIEVTCRFRGDGGGGFRGLKDGLLAELDQRKQEIHEGPVDNVYLDLPSSYYDATILFTNSRGTRTTTVRTELQLATDFASRFEFHNACKKLEVPGNGKYLKKVNIDVQVTPDAEAAWWGIHTQVHFEIDKPWFIPGGVFKDEIKKSIEGGVEDTEYEVISRVAPVM